MCVCVHVCMHVRVHVRVCASACACAYACAYMCVYMCMCMCVCVCLCTRVCVCVHSVYTGGHVKTSLPCLVLSNLTHLSLSCLGSLVVEHSSTCTCMGVLYMLDTYVCVSADGFLL